MISALFCSDKCRDEHMEKDIDHEASHQTETDTFIPYPNQPCSALVLRILMMYHDMFGSTDELRKFVEAHEKNSYNIFDFDWSTDDPKERLKNMLLLKITGKSEMKDEFQSMLETIGKKSTKLGPNRLNNILVQDSPQNLKFMNKFYTQLFDKDLFGSSSHYMSYASNQRNHILATFSHPALKLLGKCCDPNVFTHFDTNGKIVWTVNQPIAAGSELTAFWTNSGPYYRSQLLQCDSKENCLPCRNKWNNLIDFNTVEMDLEMSMMRFYQQHDPAKVSSLIKHIGEICDYINTHFDGYYKNSRSRQKIASKKEELRKILDVVPCQLPAYSKPMIFSKCHPASNERETLDNHYAT